MRDSIIQKMLDMGCILARHGGKHDWYTNPKLKISQPVPRHNEINEHLAKHILRKLGG
jgi:predicted RNA binding protein YcfA (HicA-like mRNA interferase family)